MLILASNSPRRKEILEMLGFDFKIVVSHCDETVDKISPKQTVMELSKRKAMAINCEETDIIIGSDTIVCLNDNILGKPKDKDDAIRMLKSLSGNCHEVFTGVTIISGKKCITDYVSAKVYFKKMSEDEIIYYVNTNEPMDKAGAYAIQGKGAAYIEKIEGDFFAVMGLPACFVSKALAEFNIFPKNFK